MGVCGSCSLRPLVSLKGEETCGRRSPAVKVLSQSLGNRKRQVNHARPYFLSPSPAVIPDLIADPIHRSTQTVLPTSHDRAASSALDPHGSGNEWIPDQVGDDLQYKPPSLLILRRTERPISKDGRHIQAQAAHPSRQRAALPQDEVDGRRQRSDGASEKPGKTVFLSIVLPDAAKRRSGTGEPESMCPETRQGSARRFAGVPRETMRSNLHCLILRRTGRSVSKDGRHVQPQAIRAQAAHPSRQRAALPQDEGRRSGNGEEGHDRASLP